MPAASLANKILSGTRQGVPNPKVYRVLISGSVRGGLGLSPNAGTSRQELQVIAQTPEEISLQIENEWEPLVANGEILSQEGIGSQALDRGLQAARALTTGGGITSSNQGLTSHIWRGTSPLEIQLPLLLNATSDAFQEVVVPIRNLIRLASPYQISASQTNNIFGNLMHAPGPTILDIVEGRTNNNIRLHIGRLIYIPSVVITSIEASIPNRYTREGYPIEADINISLRTHYTYLREDYEQIFGGRQ